VSTAKDQPTTSYVTRHCVIIIPKTFLNLAARSDESLVLNLSSLGHDSALDVLIRCGTNDGTGLILQARKA